MLSSLTSGVSGLDSFQEQMDVIGNNIANLNTNGYKDQTVDFSDTFSNVLQAPDGGTSTTSGGNGVQIGTGVMVADTNSNWAQGVISGNNGVPSNLAINGSGFFMVRDTVTNTQYATRTGAFSVDNNGYLIDPSGDRVQGYTGSGTTLGDIQITNGGSTTASVSSYNINSQGQVDVTLTDGTSIVSGQVLMQNFQDPNKLVNEGNNLYSNMAGAGPLSAISAAGTNGLGVIQSSALELSNVDLSAEMANLITAQRGFEANSKIITTSDEILDTVVNMKH
jgi:flagellar hook protein FlgE